MGQSRSKKYTAEQIEEARQLYFNYTEYKVIVEKTGLPKTAIKHYSNSSWHGEREARKSELVEALAEGKRDRLINIVKLGLTVLEKGLESLSKEFSDPERIIDPKKMINEMKGISDIVSNMDKVVKLDEGSATDIVAEIKPASIAEIRELIAKDPFGSGKIEDVTFKELTEDSSPTSND